MPAPWIALGAGAYLAFAAAFLPASVAYRWFAPDEFRLSGVQGTLWSGRAALGSVGALGLHDIRWRLRPGSLLLARVDGRIQARLADGFLHTEVRARTAEIVLTELTASCRLPALAGVLPIGGILGQISVELDELVLRDGWPASAAGELRLGELRVPPVGSGGELVSLGNYNVTFSGTDGLMGAFEDRGGPLQVSGSAELSADGSYRIQGIARARPEAATALTRGLELMTGAPDDAGMRSFRFTGSL